jgi:hypothetical protein
MGFRSKVIVCTVELPGVSCSLLMDPALTLKNPTLRDNYALRAFIMWVLTT